VDTTLKSSFLLFSTELCKLLIVITVKPLKNNICLEETNSRKRKSFYKKKPLCRKVLNISLCFSNECTVASKKKTGRQNHIGYFFKFHLEVGVEETIVNTPLFVKRLIQTADP
jgi:hypothetical protein